ncbi:MAG: rod shape-determining protein RodA [candidate division Zixibacteria bacterium]|nr:rod shape-determining protein RodA [candidate division Zixibacteria bacterium]
MLDYRILDWKLIGSALLLSLIGIVIIMTSQHGADSELMRTFYVRQSYWLIIAFIIFAVIIHMPPRLFDFSAYLVYAVSIILLILVLFIGSSRMGATRWISLGVLNFAPSDIAKLTLILALSRFLAYTKLQVASKRRLAITIIMTIIPMILILKQPDLGTSVVFPVILFSLWFWSGLSPWYLILILSPLASLVVASHIVAWVIYFIVLILFLLFLKPGVLFSVVVVITNLAGGTVLPFIWNRLADYQKLRILTFLDPGRDPRGAGYQIIQSKIAVGSGGVFGKGIFEGSQTRLEFLPERHTDFIFSVLGEEFGMWGALIVLILFGIIFYRAVMIAFRCRSRFASNVVMGATFMLLFQLFVNVGMTLGFMPVTGLALPFLSYGGTSLVLSWSLIGLIVLTDYHWQEY